MDQKKIGKYIADKRKALGMTQVSLADKLDVSDIYTKLYICITKGRC